jgi:predicted ABC-type ATPase
MSSKNVYIIAGPNGSGKSTFAEKFLPDYAKCPNFINADLIAKGLSPFSPRTAALKAGKLVLAQIHEFAKKGIDFGFETTLSGKLYVKLFKKLREDDYQLHLFFLWLPSPQLAIERIKERVREGGHDVPIRDIRRRFYRSVANFFKLYQPFLNSWMILNNTGIRPALIARSASSKVVIFDKELFGEIKKMEIKI